MNYNDIGKKIRNLAETVAVIVSACCIVYGGYIAIGGMLSDTGMNQVLIGVSICVLGSVLAWVASFALYGFGQLIVNTEGQLENDERIVELLESIDRKLSECTRHKDTEKKDT